MKNGAFLATKWVGCKALHGRALHWDFFSLAQLATGFLALVASAIFGSQNISLPGSVIYVIIITVKYYFVLVILRYDNKMIHVYPVILWH